MKRIEIDSENLVFVFKCEFEKCDSHGETEEVKLSSLLEGGTPQCQDCDTEMTLDKTFIEK